MKKETSSTKKDRVISSPEGYSIYKYLTPTSLKGLDKPILQQRRENQRKESKSQSEKKMQIGNNNLKSSNNSMNDGNSMKSAGNRIYEATKEAKTELGVNRFDGSICSKSEFSESEFNDKSSISQISGPRHVGSDELIFLKG